MSNSASSPGSTPSDGTSSDSAPPPATQPPPSSDPSSSPPTLASSHTVAPPTDSNGSNSSPPTAPPGTPPPEKPPPSPPVPSPPVNESPSNIPSPPVEKPSPTPTPPVSPPPQEVSVPPPTIRSHRASPPQPLPSPTPPAPIVAPPTPRSVPVPAPPKSSPPDQAVTLPPPTTPSPVQPVPQPTTPTTPNATSTPAITPGNPSLPTPVGSNQSNSSVGDSNGSTLTPPPSGSAPPSGGFKVGAIIGIGTAGLGTVLIMVGVVYFYFLRKLKKKKSRLGSLYMPPKEGYYHNPPASVDSYYASKLPPSPSAVGNPYAGYGSYGYHQGLLESAGSKSTFTYEELAHITNGFSRENLLGEGGFGWVYMGSLPDGRNVAVKQLKAGGGQVEREYRAEVETISRVHHRHLVSLVGFCIAENHRVLVYEFVPNKTLEHHLHGKGLPVLDWPKRLKIAIGAARGLAYLHEGCHPRIIHRDIKSANILLDNSFEAQVADFGLAKLTNDANTHVSTRVMGTFGYMAPEYATSGKLTDRSDVFSFGVVLLELITGRKPIDPTQPPGNESLVEWARPLLVHALETGDYKELVDARLENNFVESEMLRMIEAAAACVRHSAPKRPSMVQVLRALDNNGDIPDLSNGVKFGQSTVYNSSQYSADIRNFRRLAFAADECSMEYGRSSGEHSHQSSVLTGGFPNTEESHGPVCATSSTESSTDQRGSP